MIIYTLDWVQERAEAIASSWNGKDSKYTVEGDIYTEDDAHLAAELLEKLAEVRVLLKELDI